MVIVCIAASAQDAQKNG